jgi:hypothetical protein
MILVSAFFPKFFFYDFGLNTSMINISTQMHLNRSPLKTRTSKIVNHQSLRANTTVAINQVSKLWTRLILLKELYLEFLSSRPNKKANFWL